MGISTTIRYSMELVGLAFSGKLFGDLLEMKRLFERNLAIFFTKEPPKIIHDILVSIIVPTMNEEKRLGMLLESIRRSWYKNIEVIVADYNSYDKTREIAEKYGAEVVNVDKPGIGYATYLGTKYANGEILIRVDADTIIPPHVIYNTVKIFQQHHDVLVYHVGHFYHDGDFIDNLLAFLYDKYWRKPWNTTGHFIAFRREVMKRVNFDPNLRYHEDYNFGERVKDVYGSQAFLFNRYDAVFISSRRIRKVGKVRYILGPYTRL